VKFVIDIDGVIAEERSNHLEYSKCVPKKDVIDCVNKLFNSGNYIILFTSRFEVDKQVTMTWLEKNNVLYNELILGKPRADFYIDDRAMRPNEFKELCEQNV
jgi:CMP-N,N'-diacetyllegionaminic acid synthase